MTFVLCPLLSHEHLFTGDHWFGKLITVSIFKQFLKIILHKLFANSFFCGSSRLQLVHGLLQHPQFGGTQGQQRWSSLRYNMFLLKVINIYEECGKKNQKTYISRLVHTMSFWNNLHQLKIKRLESQKNQRV